MIKGSMFKISTSKNSSPLSFVGILYNEVENDEKSFL